MHLPYHRVPSFERDSVFSLHYDYVKIMTREIWSQADDVLTKQAKISALLHELYISNIKTVFFSSENKCLLMVKVKKQVFCVKLC